MCYMVLSLAKDLKTFENQPIQPFNSSAEASRCATDKILFNKRWRKELEKIWNWNKFDKQQLTEETPKLMESTTQMEKVKLGGRMWRGVVEETGIVMSVCVCMCVCVLKGRWVVKMWGHLSLL